MIIIGLFHGLIVLPVALSLLCPEPYNHYTKLSATKSDQINGSVKPVNGILKTQTIQ